MSISCRKLSLSLAATLVVAALSYLALVPAALGQDKPAIGKAGIEGTWQGTLQVPNQRDFRLVLKITKAEPGGLKVTLHSIDQTPQPIPAASASFEGGVLKFAIDMANATYEGKVSSDNQSINGTWKQGPLSLSLLLARATPATEWAIPEAPAAIPPMAADAVPNIETATIKPSRPDQPGFAITIQGTKLLTINTTAANLIDFAYGVQTKQIVSGPSWLETDKYDIVAQADIPGSPNVAQLRTMVQKLLTERLQLKFHRDQREMSAYLLTVAKSGSKLKKSEDQSALPGLFFPQLGVMLVHNASMVEFANTMQSTVLDRPVIDQTSLPGKFDFTLKWTPDESQFGGMGMRVPAPSDAADAPPPLFTAIQEQIGLRLSAEKAPVPVLVIDKLEKPSEN